MRSLTHSRRGGGNILILVCGIPSEPPIAMVRAELQALGLPYAMLNQREIWDVDLEIAIADGFSSGQLTISGENYGIEEFTGIYNRLIPMELIPRIREGNPASATWARSRAVHDTLLAWTEISVARVVNPASAMGSNSSKGYQSQLIRAHGFEVPATLTTNDPELASTFCRTYSTALYKSISSVRSIVRAVRYQDLDKMEQILWCPVQFQEYVPGINVRVHTVGRTIYASQIVTDAIDYRYAHLEGGRAEVFGITLSNDLVERCIGLAQSLGLHMSGIDLILGPAGRVYCLEVNPSPAFNYYEARTGQPISRQLALFLACDAP
jgi:hypothetical protein